MRQQQRNRLVVTVTLTTCTGSAASPDRLVGVLRSASHHLSACLSKHENRSTADASVTRPGHRGSLSGVTGNRVGPAGSRLTARALHVLRLRGSADGRGGGWRHRGRRGRRPSSQRPLSRRWSAAATLSRGCGGGQVSAQPPGPPQPPPARRAERRRAPGDPSWPRAVGRPGTDRSHLTANGKLAQVGALSHSSFVRGDIGVSGASTEARSH